MCIYLYIVVIICMYAATHLWTTSDTKRYIWVPRHLKIQIRGLSPVGIWDWQLLVGLPQGRKWVDKFN